MELSILQPLLKQAGVIFHLSSKTMMVVKGGAKVFVGISKSKSVNLADVEYIGKILGIKI